MVAVAKVQVSAVETPSYRELRRHTHFAVASHAHPTKRARWSAHWRPRCTQPKCPVVRCDETAEDRQLVPGLGPGLLRSPASLRSLAFRRGSSAGFVMDVRALAVAVEEHDELGRPVHGCERVRCHRAELSGFTGLDDEVTLTES